MICEKCMHFGECFEQRGRCTQFITPKQARKKAREDIESINKKRRKPAADTKTADKAGIREECAGAHVEASRSESGKTADCTGAPKKKRGKPTKAIEKRVRRQKEARSRRKAEALRLYKSGMDLQKIADTMGIKLNLVLDYTRGVRETKTNAERYKYDADMIRMYNEGKTYVQMADELGVELWKVNQICKRLRESGKVQGRNKTWYVRR